VSIFTGLRSSDFPSLFTPEKLFGLLAEVVLLIAALLWGGVGGTKLIEKEDVCYNLMRIKVIRLL
jgi:hypothetical protein